MAGNGHPFWPHFPQFYAKAAYRFLAAAWLGLLLAACIQIGSSLAAEGEQKSQKKGEEDAPIILALPPSGFQHLTEPQITLVDVYYQGRRIGATMATFSPGRLEFENLEEVIANLADLRDVVRVKSALTGILDANSALICGDGREPDCGRLEPEVAGIIFDSNRFRVDLFVNPIYLVEKGLIRPAFMPVPDAGFSALQSVAAAYAGNSDTNGKFNIGSNTILGYDQRRLQANTTVSDDDGFAVDRLTGEWEQPGWLYGGGLYRTAVVPLLGDQPFYGIRVNSSADTRLDLERVRGTQLQVFLSRRAQVDILREGRLLSTGSYSAGNQILDTSNLPSGAYDVTLRIREAGGAVREERRFFSKSSQMPPADMPRYVLELGVLAGTDFDPFPKPDDRPVLHGGTTHRLGQNYALGADAFLSTEAAALEADAYYQNRMGTISVGAFGSTNGAFGVVLKGYGSIDRFSYSLSARRIWGSGEDLSATDAPALPNAGGGSSTQATLNLGYAFKEGPRLSLRGFWRHTDGVGDSYSIGPGLNYPLYRGRGMRLDLFADAAHGNLETVARVRFRLFWDTPSHFVTASGGYQHSSEGEGPTESGFLGVVDAGWRDQDLVRGDLQFGAGLESEPQGSSGRIKGNYAGSTGRADAQVEQDFDGENTTRYAANLFFNVLGNDGAVALGGRETTRSGVIVALDGDAEATFDVLVDGYPKASVRNGDRLPLLLSEYKMYEIRLKPVNAPAISFDSRVREVSLYPGTIKTLRWSVNRVVTVFGRLVEGDGKPISDARIEGAVEPAFTDAGGYFQAVVSKRATLKVKISGGRICNVSIDVSKTQEEFTTIENLTCG